MAAQYILGLDYGEKRIGVAITQVIARLPRPLTTLQNTDTLLNDIRTLIEQEDAGLVVVGLPRGMDGGYTQQTRTVETFAEQLAAVIDVPVELADETLTSVDAESTLAGSKHGKGDIDALAATYILERYLTEHPVMNETGHNV